MQKYHLLIVLLLLPHCHIALDAHILLFFIIIEEDIWYGIRIFVMFKKKLWFGGHFLKKNVRHSNKNNTFKFRHNVSTQFYGIHR